MSQDTSTHNVDEGRRPAGTEDLLPGRHDDEHEHQGREEDRLDGDRMDGDRMGGDRVDGDRMDQDRPDQDRLDDQSHLDDQAPLHDQGRLGGRDRMGGGRMDGDRMDADRTDADRTDADRTDADRTDADRADGTGRFGTASPMQAGGQWTDEERTADGDRTVDREVDGELGDVGQSQFGQQQGPMPTATGGTGATPLFAEHDVSGFRSRWTELQAAFVDDPRTAVQQADQLVAEVMQSLAATFAKNKQDLEGQWQREGTADTEDLRQAMRRYRMFFDQLLRTSA